MFDNDDIRYSTPEKRPPWEVGPADRLWDLFSRPDQDDPAAEYLGRSAETPETTPNRPSIRSGFARSNARSDRQEAAPPPPPPDGGDPRAGRYIYQEPPRSSLGQRRKKSNLTGVAIIVVLALIIGGVSAGILEAVNATEDYDSSWSHEEATPYSGIDPDSDWYDGDWYDEVPWDEIVPDEGADVYDDETGAAQTELERAELTGSLSVDIRSAQGLEPLAYQDLYAKCFPSTVSITVYGADSVGTGTGIVMTEDGYILTCNHVVEGGVTCQVTTYDDQVYDALLVGGDAQTDLAVLKIDAQGLQAAEFGDSDELTVGDEALAIGDPLGAELRGTLTNGIISAINRNVTVRSYSMTLIQTTAALNSGNSGGPLINIYGQVVGVNNMKMNSTIVTVEGLGFAVPTSVVREIVPTLTAEGRISRPVLGITCYGINQDTADRNNEATTGLRVSSVHVKSDAYVQGLQEGDYITQVNGIHVESVEEVKAIIGDLSIGDTVELTVLRIDENDSSQSDEFVMTVALVDQSELY